MTTHTKYECNICGVNVFYREGVIDMTENRHVCEGCAMFIVEKAVVQWPSDTKQATSPI